MTQLTRTLVAGIANVDASDPVVRYAIQMADRLGAALHVVHAVAPPLDSTTYLGTATLDPGTAALPAPDLPREPDWQQSLQGRLAEAVSRHAGAGARILPQVRVGAAHDTLSRVAEEVGADLLLVGASRHERFLGTTAGRVLRRASVPVLVFRGAPGGGESRVLLTTDLSELSAHAYSVGVDTVRALFGHAPLALRCVLVAGYDPALLPPPDPGAVREAATGALLKFLAEQEHHGVEVEPVVRLGVSTEEIVSEAREWPADLVVLGTHGRSGLSRMFLGSVAEATLRDLPCTALVVPGATAAAED